MTTELEQTEARADRVERELDETRSRLEGTLDAIKDQLTPTRLLDEVWRWVGQHGEEARGVASALARVVARNPLPVALAGSGLAWLAAHEASRAAGGDGDAGERASRREAARADGEAGGRWVAAAHRAVDLVASGVLRAAGLVRRAAGPLAGADLPRLVGAGALGAAALVSGAAVGLCRPS